MVKFYEDSHTYKYEDKKYTSVTQLIKKFKQPFNQKFWSKYKAIERLLPKETFDALKKGYGNKLVYMTTLDPGLVETTRLEIVEEWKKKSTHSSQRGTKFHNKKEEESYQIGEQLNIADGKKYQTFKKEVTPQVNASLTENLYDLEDGFYPELLLWNHEYRIAGQADRVFISTKGKKRYIDIEDFKTNSKIKISNYFQKMKRPLSYLDDCNYNHYALQISTYAWLLGEFGFVPRHLSFDHFKEGQGDPKRYNLTYMKKEVSQMLTLLRP